MGKLTDEQRNDLISLLYNTWTPHAGQEQAGQAVFSSDADLVYVECGRKFGKSEFATYCCWLYAILYDNAEVYYLAPAVKQAKELVWYNSRMQSCNSYSEDFLIEVERIMGGEVKILYHEARILLPNGSFIKVDGSDNYNTQRGLKPDFVVADEYRDFKPQWIEATRPNMMVKQGKILFITTPPHGPNHAYKMAEECRKGQSKKDDNYFYLNLPSFWNDRLPHNREWLAKEQRRLESEGRHNEWRREYMAEYIASDEHAVLPQLNRGMVEPKEDLIKVIKKNTEKMIYMVTMDPGNSTRFAALFSVYCPITSTIFILDSLFEDNSQKTSLSFIFQRINEITAEYKEIGLKVSDPIYVHNCKCPWVQKDLNQVLDKASNPCNPEYKDVTYGINLLKDSIASGKIRVSDKCADLITESELFIRHHESGEVPKEPRQLINCLRYIPEACGFDWECLHLQDQLPPDEEFIRKLGLTLEDVMPQNVITLNFDPDFGYFDVNDDF